MLKWDGSKLKELRRKRNWTQKDVGMFVGKGPNYIGNYENGYADPPADTLLTLMSLFQCSFQDVSKCVETNYNQTEKSA